MHSGRFHLPLLPVSVTCLASRPGFCRASLCGPEQAQVAAGERRDDLLSASDLGSMGKQLMRRLQHACAPLEPQYLNLGRPPPSRGSTQRCDNPGEQVYTHGLRSPLV